LGRRFLPGAAAAFFEPGHNKLNWSSAMIVGITMLAVLTIIAIVDVWKTSGKPFQTED
jgi:hypothetical protein